MQRDVFSSGDGANDVGAARLLESMAEFGLADIEGIADAILGLLRDPSRSATLAANAGRLVRENYSEAAFTAKARAFADGVESLLRGTV